MRSVPASASWTQTIKIEQAIRLTSASAQARSSRRSDTLGPGEDHLLICCGSESNNSYVAHHPPKWMGDVRDPPVLRVLVLDRPVASQDDLVRDLADYYRAFGLEEL